MKKSLFIGILLFIMSIMIVQAKDKTLYGVLKNEANSGGLARKYAGEHQDSFAGTGDKDIYHWYADNDTDGTAILDKNNVIFAGHCWQMIRTTDTGGVKLLYNGETQNGKCLDTRENHVGYASSTTQNLSTTYYYGTDYTYDKANNVFTLSGTVTTGAINIGEYTCKSTTADGTCATLYLVDMLSNGPTYYVLSLNGNSPYSLFGTLPFNQKNDSPSYVGYMYNTVYSQKSKMITNTEKVLTTKTFAYGSVYSDTFILNNPILGRYNMLNPNSFVSGVSNSLLVGNYIMPLFFQQEYEGNTYFAYDTIYYIAGTSGRDAYCIQLGKENNNPHDFSFYNHTYTYGDSFTDNNDGTYTINNPITIERKDWYTSYRNVGANKYVCKNAVNNTCSELWYTTATSATDMTYIGVGNVYKYAKSFTWDGSKYVLNNDETSTSFWYLNDSANKAKINNAHYTCWNETGECTTVSYIYYISDTTLYYINLTNGKDIEVALNEMLHNSGVNTVNSTVKNGIDAWYKHYLLSTYDEYVEDTIFCNDRSISSLEAWNPDGGNITKYLQFKDNTTKDLSCANLTDQFSVSNNKARLIYKVGLLSSPELNILNNKNAQKSEKSYWLVSPSSYSKTKSVTGSHVYYTRDGNVYFGGTENAIGVRPVISLKPGTTYTLGNGSMDSPYVVGELSKHDIVVNNDDEKGTIQIDEVNDVEESSDVSFSIDTVLGYQVKSVVIKDADNQSIEYQFSNNRYSFEMPASDVTITVTYEKVKSSINVQIVNETKDLNIEINDLTQVEYQEEVVFKVTPIKGYKLNTIKVIDSNNQEIEVEETNNKNEYSFIMPVENVTIIPSYEKVSNSVVVEDNSNTKEIIISVNDSTAVVYEELVKVTIVPVEGYELEKLIIVDEEGNSIEYQKTNKENEYSFVMPDTNVSITPVYKEIPKPIVNPKTGSKILPIIIIFFAVIGTSFYAMKKRI